MLVMFTMLSPWINDLMDRTNEIHHYRSTGIDAAWDTWLHHYNKTFNKFAPQLSVDK